MTFDDFKDITHIWFSHEHPDHFLPDNLKKISPEHRRAIEVLFQETRDKKVIRYCGGIGFGKVTELQPRTWIKLDDQLHVMNCPNDTNWLADSVVVHTYADGHVSKSERLWCLHSIARHQGIGRRGGCARHAIFLRPMGQ